MAKWWKPFGKKDKEQGPPETPPTPAAPTPAAPTPAAPTPAAPTPAAPAPAAPAPPPEKPPAPAEEKKRSFFGRLADKVTGKAKKEKAKKEKAEAKAEAEAEAEAPPEAPPEAPSAPPSAPPAEEPEAAGGGPAAPEKERHFPSSISASAYGDWVISANKWYGEMSGTLTGSSVKEFVLAHEKGNWTRCCELIAEVWDSPAADIVDVYASNIEAVTWS
ncbi:hypothetical protein [Streptomyces laurentii]|uniref:hypothetical protein n=1 Tax=Streptomyces laurentii TaxID=39478 RepID=UPI0033DCEF5B